MIPATAPSPNTRLPAGGWSARDHEVYAEQVDLLERNVRQGVGSGILALPLIGYVLFGWQWPAVFWAWVAGIVAVLGTTLLWCRRWRHTRPRPLDARPWGRAVSVLSGLLGVAWGLAPVLFFQPRPEAEAALLVLAMAILVSGCTGGAAVLSSAIALMVPTAGLYALAALHAGGEFAGMAALIAAAMLALLIFYAYNINRAIVGAIRLRLENRDLNEALTEQRVNERTRVLEAASRHKSEFLASMSHELRTPLNAIIGYSEMLQEDAVDAGAAALVPDLQKITRSGHHLLELINAVLDLSKIEAGKLDLHPQLFDVATLAAEVAALVPPLATARGNRFDLVCPAAVGTMQADPTKLRQVLLNLIGNACKFTENGEVTLQVTREAAAQGDWLCFAVSDTGIGISAEHQALLFQDFVQVGQAGAARLGGTGLGLALSRRLCRLMGGDITLSSEPGRGSRFVARLPSGLAAEPAVPPAVPAGAPSRAGTVLVIDDEGNARDLLQRHLLREGYAVLTAASGADGLALARSHRPDVITLDVMMPGIDGWTVLAELAADPALAAIPVIMLTMVDEKQTGYALGAVDYLTKPVDRQRLLSALARYRHDLPLLLVGDEALQAGVAPMMQAAGHAVVAARGSHEALQLFDRQPPGAVLLDLALPGGDGLALLAALHAHAQWHSVPVLVITDQNLSPAQREHLERPFVRVLERQGRPPERWLAELGEQLAGALGSARRSPP